MCEYKKKYYQKNREHILEKRKQYREQNRDIINKKNNIWYKKNHSIQIIKKWKKQGFKHDEDFFNELSIKYENITHCELCDIKFEKSGNNKKETDHHHSSGSFRNICCHKCNMNRLKVDHIHLTVMMEMHRYFIRIN